MLTFEGHAIISADGMIADAAGNYPPALRNEADWAQYQQALDRAALVVLGHRAHRNHPNPGRRRLVLTRSISGLAADASDPLATLWNPAALPLCRALADLGITAGAVAITGAFDQFIADYTSFELSEKHGLALPGGRPCFSLGHPRTILSHAGLNPARVKMLDPIDMVTTTSWTR